MYPDSRAGESCLTRVHRPQRCGEKRLRKSAESSKNRRGSRRKSISASAYYHMRKAHTRVDSHVDTLVIDISQSSDEPISFAVESARIRARMTRSKPLLKPSSRAKAGMTSRKISRIRWAIASMPATVRLRTATAVAAGELERFLHIFNFKLTGR